MAESPQQSSQGQQARRLAERYGMTPDAVEDLMRETHSEYPNQTMPPIAPTTTTPIEQAAATLPNDRQPIAPLHSPTKPLSGGFIAALFAVLLIGLGVALSFRQGCFQQRADRRSAKPMDTIQNMLNREAERASTPPQNPSNVAPGEVPPEALVVPREEPPGTSGRPSSPGLVLTTSSNFEAEERLAELRASGNTRAHMKAVRKHGQVSYRVLAN